MDKDGDDNRRDNSYGFSGRKDSRSLCSVREPSAALKRYTDCPDSAAAPAGPEIQWPGKEPLHGRGPAQVSWQMQTHAI